MRFCTKSDLNIFRVFGEMSGTPRNVTQEFVEALDGSRMCLLIACEEFRYLGVRKVPAHYRCHLFYGEKRSEVDVYIDVPTFLFNLLRDAAPELQSAA